MLLRSAIIGLICAASWLHAQQAAVQFEKNVMVAMGDGVKLATDVYRPAGSAEKLPVILARTPYNKDNMKSYGEYFAAHGYAFVVQDTRGRYASEGRWHWLTDDGADGTDCAAWIAAQPWADGKIGMVGTSYYGGTQHAMALTKVPQLTTVIPVDAVSNMGRQSMRNAGAFEMRFWNWIMLNAGKGSNVAPGAEAQEELKKMADERLDYLAKLPLLPGATPLKLAPEYEDWLIQAMRHGKDDAFWAQNNILADPSRYKDMPVYLVGGWYDSWAGNTTANFQALSKTLKSDVYLIMGPWIHGAQGKSAHGQVDFGKSAAIADELAWRKEWFDHWMKGLDNSVGKTAPFAKKVRIFVMGTGDGSKTKDGILNHGGQWRDENEWPLARAKPTPMYLYPEKLLSDVKPQGVDGAMIYKFDPKNPVPTIGGNISSADGIMQQGAWDQRGGDKFWNWPKPLPISAHSSVCVFQTAPLAEDVEITGEIEVKLWASSDAVDTDFTAKLIDVHPSSTDWPEGFDLNITDGIIRARFRESLQEEKLMEPGKVYPFTIKLYPTSNVFKKGHRVRVDISSSNFPRFDVNPNTGEPLQQHTHTITATNTIRFGSEYPSHILLPVVPKR